MQPTILTYIALVLWGWQMYELYKDRNAWRVLGVIGFTAFVFGTAIPAKHYAGYIFAMAGIALWLFAQYKLRRVRA